MMYWHLASLLSGKNEEKMKILTDREKPKKTSACYLRAYNCFMQYCLYDHYQVSLNYLQEAIIEFEKESLTLYIDRTINVV